MQIQRQAVSSGVAAELERVRFVSKNFYALQGWRWVPAGLLVMLLSSIGSNAVSLLASTISPPSWFVAFLLEVAVGLDFYIGMLACSWWVGWYYDTRFGRVEPRRLFFIWPAAAMGIITGAQLLGYLNRWTGSPISFSALAITAYFASRRGAWKERRHLAWLALIFLASSVIPVLTGPFILWGAQPVTFMDILKFAFGLALVVAGLFDHAVLARSLPAPHPEEGTDSSDLQAEELG